MISSTVTLTSLSSAQVLGGTTVRTSSPAKQSDRPAWARAQAPWPFRVATPFGPSVAMTSNVASGTAAA